MPVDRTHPDSESGLLAQARDRLRDKPPKDHHWAALGAAALFALCALVFAAAAVLAPPLIHQPAAKVGVR